MAKKLIDATCTELRRLSEPETRSLAAVAVAEASTRVPYRIGFHITPYTYAIFQVLDGQRTDI